MEVEGQQGDVILRLGVVVEEVVAVVLQDAAATDVVEQTVAVGNLAVTLQQTCTDEVGDDELYVAVPHGGIALGHELVHPVEHLAGVGVVGGEEIGEGHIVARPQLTVDIIGQRVLHISQRTVAVGQTALRVAVAVDESLLVQPVDTRAPQRVHPLLLAAAPNS